MTPEALFQSLCRAAAGFCNLHLDWSGYRRKYKIRLTLDVIDVTTGHSRYNRSNYIYTSKGQND